MADRLFISFSGGETSAFMAQWLVGNATHKERIVLFANTGQENEQTLDFVERCDRHFGLGVVWVEADVSPERGVGTAHRVVNFDSADRTGSMSFEPMIKKYGIPNMSMPHCTRELKLNPMTSYLRSIGWGAGSYETAIGIRVDEIDRMSPNAKQKGIIYPLISRHMRPMTKPQINQYWRDMPFRLELKGYQGNCKWCWKKTIRKHLTLIQEDASQYDFPARMEAEHGMRGSLAEKTGEPQRFFRQRLSTQDLMKMAEDGGFSPASDDAVVYHDEQIKIHGEQIEMDLSAGCSESCEVFHD